mmetsp:Transcript_7127/g.28831  ORF Transcript_7127/g.28831 Transcript_7127/m.28831 type:complete len:232 (+) Transcript_7127:1535-2230(+)
MRIAHGRASALRDEDSSRRELLAQQSIEIRRVQLIARPPIERVAQIHDDHVKAPIGLVRQSFLRVADDQTRSFIPVRPRAVKRRVLSAHVHHVAVDVHHHALLHALVPQHLAQRRSLATATDEHPLRVRVRHQRRMHQRLVIHVLVVLARLHQPIRDEKRPERHRPHDLDLLKLRRPLIQHLLDLSRASPSSSSSSVIPRARPASSRRRPRPIVPSSRPFASRRVASSRTR